MNPNKLHCFIFVLLSILCLGCATSNVEKDYSLDPSTGKGILLFSFDLFEDYKLASLFFRDLNGKNIEGAVNSMPTNLTLDWKSPWGRLIVIELKSGSYEIYGLGVIYFKKNESFSIPFEIFPGKVTYIGCIYLRLLFSENYYIYTPFDLKVIDMSDRDITLFLQRYLNMKPDQIIKDISQVNYHY